MAIRPLVPGHTILYGRPKNVNVNGSETPLSQLSSELALMLFPWLNSKMCDENGMDFTE